MIVEDQESAMKSGVCLAVTSCMRRTQQRRGSSSCKKGASALFVGKREKIKSFIPRTLVMDPYFVEIKTTTQLSLSDAPIPIQSTTSNVTTQLQPVPDMHQTMFHKDWLNGWGRMISGQQSLLFSLALCPKTWGLICTTLPQQRWIGTLDLNYSLENTAGTSQMTS